MGIQRYAWFATFFLIGMAAGAGLMAALILLTGMCNNV